MPFLQILWDLVGSYWTYESDTEELQRPGTIPATITTGEPANFFAGASNIAFSGPVTMNDFSKSDSSVLQRLAERGLPAAIHNSYFRAYPPRCGEDTRRSLRNDVVKWGCDHERRWKIRWYMGTAGIGKSALAQSVAEAFADASCLGATFFFSRPGKLDDPDAFIPTLAYQLATKNPLYMRITAYRLEHDPLILSMDRSTQFRKLILEPFESIVAAESSSPRTPMLIVLDGLDECRDKEAQCELIRLISDRRTEKLPLLWMICSRPEWHLKSLLSDANSPLPCEHIEISADDEEAKEDGQRLLRAGLDKVRKEYDLSSSWPPAEQVDVVAHLGSGHLGLVSFIVKFIAVTDDGWDPREKFDLCVKVVSGSGIDPRTLNPVAALDSLYHEVLLKVPSRILPTTMRILGFYILYFGFQLSALDQASFLSLDFPSYAQALQALHSIVDVPNSHDASSKSILLYHASFSDFLKDPARSTGFCLNKGAVHYDVAVQSLRWLATHDADSDNCTEFALPNAWAACLEVPKEYILNLMIHLALFDFRKLSGRILSVPFPSFIAWLWLLTSVLPPEGSLASRFVNLISKSPQDCSHTLQAVQHFTSKQQARKFLVVFGLDDDVLTGSPPETTLHFLLGINPQVHVSLALFLYEAIDD